MTESTAALTRVALELCDADRVEIRVDPANIASLGVPGSSGTSRRRRCGVGFPVSVTSWSDALQGLACVIARREGVVRGLRRGGGSRPVTERLRLWLERAGGGYRLRDAATEQVVREDDPRIHVIPVAGVSYRIDDVQAEGFAPGRPLALVPEPDNEHDSNAVAIWDEDRRVQAGYVPAEVARTLRADEWQAVSLREFSEEGRREGLRVLLAPRDAWIGTPRS